MKTWNEQTKAHWVKEMTEHQEADRLIQGRWWNNEKGCFFGCAMKTETDALDKAIKEMHLPDWLVYLAEKMFEELPKEKALVFPVQLCAAIPCNTDIDKIKHKLAIYRLTTLSENNPDVSDGINGVILCHEKSISGKDNVDWSAAESAAWASAESAWAAAERSAAWAAASAAAESARSAWASSAWAWAARSASWAAASAPESESAAWSTERDNLLKLLTEIN